MTILISFRETFFLHIYCPLSTGCYQLSLLWSRHISSGEKLPWFFQNFQQRLRGLSLFRYLRFGLIPQTQRSKQLFLLTDVPSKQLQIFEYHFITIFLTAIYGKQNTIFWIHLYDLMCRIFKITNLILRQLNRNFSLIYRVIIRLQKSVFSLYSSWTAPSSLT